MGELQQPLIAGGVGAGGGVGEHAAEVGDGGRGERVAVVSTPTGAVDLFCQHGHAVVLLVWGRPWSVSAWKDEPRGKTVTGHNPWEGWTGC